MKNKIQNNIQCHSTHLPLVSIGIPTFNRPELLRQALESARSQTYPNLEILVSDNESTDAQTSKILAEASAIDFRIKTYRQKKNIGATANFEFLLRSATGEFFTWVADDDVLHPTCIELLVAAHTQNPSLACVFSDVTIIDITGNSLGIKKHAAFRHSPYKSRAENIRASFFSAPQCQATYGLFRTSIALQCPFEKTTYKNMIGGAEYTFLARLASLGNVIAVPHALRSYRQHVDCAHITYHRYHSFLDKLIRFFEYLFRVTSIAIRADSSVRLRFLFTMHSLFSALLLIASLSLKAILRLLQTFPAGIYDYKFYRNALLINRRASELAGRQLSPKPTL